VLQRVYLGSIGKEGGGGQRVFAHVNVNKAAWIGRPVRRSASVARSSFLFFCFVLRGMGGMGYSRLARPQPGHVLVAQAALRLAVVRVGECREWDVSTAVFICA
jgi:hypothetical protein